MKTEIRKTDFVGKCIDEWTKYFLIKLIQGHPGSKIKKLSGYAKLTPTQSGFSRKKINGNF